MADTLKNEVDVDALVANLAANMEVTSNSIHGEHPRFSQFKNYGMAAEKQRNRRKEWLDRQSKARAERMDKNRTVSSESVTVEEVQEISKDEQGSPKDNEGFMEVDRRRRRTKSSTTDESRTPGHRRNYFREDMKGRLMYSEFLIDVPADLENKWIMVPTPMGKRVLVLAENQYTYVYNKRGDQLSRFKCALNAKGKTTLVDAIFSNNIIYVLDYLIVNDCQLECCEFECRRVMGSSFMRETEIFIKHDAQYRFVELEAGPCDQNSMKKRMAQTYPFKLDGLLFYHSEVHYTPGETPLVGWLKPWMMPKILNVPVLSIYEEDARESPQEYIIEFTRKHPTYGLPISRREARKLSENQMDSEEVVQPI